MTSSTKEPKLLVVAGCLRGITALMVNFNKTMEEGERLCVSVVFASSIYSTLIKTANKIILLFLWLHD